MKILMHSMACPEREPAGALALAADLGLDGIELICQAGYRCGLAPDAPIRAAAALAAEARRVGVTIGAVTPYAKGLNSALAEERRAAATHLDHVLSLADTLGARVMRLFAGAEVPPNDLPRAVQIFAESARPLAERAGTLGIDLCIENHMDTMALSAALTMQVVDAIAHPSIGVIYDQGNLDFMRAEAFPQGFDLQQRSIRHVHVKDFRWDPDGNRRAALVGEGSVPWRAILEALAQRGYDRFLSLEYERRWHPDQLPVAEIGVARCRDVVRGLLADIGQPQARAGVCHVGGLAASDSAS